jgi:protein-tyrosine-phosphatase
VEIVFVCAGNTCRSSMAEGLARWIWAERWPALGDLTVSSAGVAAWSGDPASPEAVQALFDKGIDLSRHSSRKLDAEIVAGADLLLTMTGYHREHVLNTFPEAADKVFLLAAFAGQGDVDVLDPFGSSLEIYRRSADNLEFLVTRALERVAESISS